MERGGVPHALGHGRSTGGRREDGDRRRRLPWTNYRAYQRGEEEEERRVVVFIVVVIIRYYYYCFDVGGWLKSGLVLIIIIVGIQVVTINQVSSSRACLPIYIRTIFVCAARLVGMCKPLTGGYGSVGCEAVRK